MIQKINEIALKQSQDFNQTLIKPESSEKAPPCHGNIFLERIAAVVGEMLVSEFMEVYNYQFKLTNNFRFYTMCHISLNSTELKKYIYTKHYRLVQGLSLGGLRY